MRSKLDQEAAALLGRVLIFSAGLFHLWSKAKIIDAYPLLRDSRRLYRRIDARLFRSPDSISIEGIDALVATVRGFSPSDLVIATAHHGHFIAFLCACARNGIPLAACYRGAGRRFVDAVTRSGVMLIDLDRVAHAYELFAALDRARADARYVALMIDAPFPSRRRYSFLGYSVAASSALSLYARRTRSALLPLTTGMSNDRTLCYTMGQIIEASERDATQDLLSFLQSTILREYDQHQWQAGSVLLSDPAARKNSLAFLGEALAWRTRIIDRTDPCRRPPL